MRLSQQRHISGQLKRILVLIFVFVVAPSVCLLSVGILVLIFSSTPHQIVFGVLIISLVATMAVGSTAMLVHVFRGAELARLQTDFVAKVSHDLRTPLTSIRMFVETLQLGRATDPEKVKQCLDIIQSSTSRLSTMIERLLYWGRLEAGRHLYQLAEHEVSEVVEASLSAFSPQLLETPAQIECNISPNLPPIYVDQDAMVEAILNLLQNAHRYTGAEKRLQIRGGLEHQRVFISVIDNGPGIPETEYRNIFKKFYRGSASLAGDVSGSGLGLAIVEHIVRAHKGRITLDNAEGGGAIFSILLPVISLKEHHHGDSTHH